MDINNLLKQAQNMQKKMEKMNDELTKKEFYGSAQNGLVKISVLGDFKLKKIEIAEELLNSENKEILEELIVIAFNQAYEEIEKISSQNIKGLGLPF